MFTNNYLYHNLLINPTSLVTYPTFEHQFNKRNSQSFSSSKFEESKINYLGQVNNKSKAKIISAINLLYDISKKQSFINQKTKKRNYFKLNFITLTLSAAQMLVSDKLIKKECLAWWFEYAKKKFGLKSYVWKAERQKNGNLHFHITTNCFISIKDLRNSWNFAQNRVGFLDLFENKFLKIDKDYISIFVSENIRVKKMLKNQLKEKYNEYLQEVRTYERNSKIDTKAMGVQRQNQEKIDKARNLCKITSFKKNDRLPSTKQFSMNLVNYKLSK